MNAKWEALLIWWQRRRENGASGGVYYSTIMLIALGLAVLVISTREMSVVPAMLVIAKFALIGSILARMFRGNLLATLVMFVVTLVIVYVLFLLLVVYLSSRHHDRVSTLPPALSLLHPNADGAELVDYRLGERLDVPECPSAAGSLQRSYQGPDGGACFRHLTSERIGSPLGTDENVVVDRLDLARFEVFSVVQPVCVALRDGRIVGVAVHVAERRRYDVLRSMQNTFQQPAAHVRWQAVARSDSYYDRDLWTSAQVRSAMYTLTVPPLGRSAGSVDVMLVMESPEGPRPFAATRMSLGDCPAIALDYQAAAR